jgi:hypothetical protein
MEKPLDTDGGKTMMKKASNRPATHTSHVVVGIALLLSLAVAGIAGAATGVLPVGTVIEGDEQGDSSDRLTVDETVLATGSTPVGGPWRITSYASEGVTDQGTVVEAKGLPCIRFMFTNPPTGTPLRGSGFCGEARKGGVSIGSVPVRDPSGEIELVLFGEAPEGAASIEVARSNGPTVDGSIHPGPDTSRNYWAIPLPEDTKDPTVSWLDENGQRGSRPLDASTHLDRLVNVRPQT